jgi:hypothetical protein
LNAAATRRRLLEETRMKKRCLWLVVIVTMTASVLPGQTVIDLSDDARQTVLLALPLKHLCREDCRGLCPQFGRNLNEGTCDCRETRLDGRWDKLKEFQNNKSNQAG